MVLRASKVPERFWHELADTGFIVCEKPQLNAATLAAFEGAESIEPDDIDPAWTRQNGGRSKSTRKWRRTSS